MPDSTTNPTIPAEVQSLLDEAVDTGPYSAMFTATSIKLVDAHTHEVIREVQWPGAWEFARNLLSNSLGQQ